MTSRPKFPFGLTIAVVIVFAVCCGLGTWQLQRAAWKATLLNRIAEAHRTVVPQPLGPVLADADRAGPVMFLRVVADCQPGSAPLAYRMTTDGQDWVARAQAACRLPLGGRYASVLVDRGILSSSRGATTAPSLVLPPPGHIVGVLINKTRDLPAGLPQPAPFVLVAESETPAPPGVQPALYGDPAENLQYVGAYATTWFGLAGVLAAIYAAMLWRRYHPKA